VTFRVGQNVWWRLPAPQYCLVKSLISAAMRHQSDYCSRIRQPRLRVTGRPPQSNEMQLAKAHGSHPPRAVALSGESARVAPVSAILTQSITSLRPLKFAGPTRFGWRRRIVGTKRSVFGADRRCRQVHSELPVIGNGPCSMRFGRLKPLRRYAAHIS
jgi:hypothetical protein